MSDINDDLHGLTYLFSSFLPLPDQHFQGFAFVGSHYVAGADGASAYEQHQGIPVPPGEDGCYVTVRKTPAGHQIGVDHAGLKKMFCYSNGDVWCVSNSLALMAEHLTSHGAALTVNAPQLLAFKMSGTFNSQVTATATIFKEITLIPLRCTVNITAGHLTITRHSAATPKPYREALTDYANTWVARTRTLLDDPRMWLNIDLSGGVDSRTVFALVQAAAGDTPRHGRIHIRSSPAGHLAADLEAAAAITSHYGIPLNAATTGRPPQPRCTTAERYEGWRRICLGTYMPVYFPDRHPTARVVQFHGGGGENHRPFYKADNLDQLLNRMKHVQPADLFDQWKQDVREDLDQLHTHQPHLDPLVLHYREFRNRFHAGLNAQYRIVCSPLSSRLLESLSHDPALLSSRQVHYDVMETLLPGLKDMPYDTPTKAPSADNVARLTVADWDRDTPAGMVFASESAATSVPAEDAAAPYELMQEAVAESSRPAVVDFLGANTTRAAADVIQTAAGAGKFERAADAKTVTHVLTAGFAFKVAGLG